MFKYGKKEKIQGIEKHFVKDGVYTTWNDYGEDNRAQWQEIRAILSMDIQTENKNGDVQFIERTGNKVFRGDPELQKVEKDIKRDGKTFS